jgi:hypothetical protein
MEFLAIIAKPAPTAAATNDIRGIQPPIQIPLGWLWAIWLLGLLALAALAWWYWRRRRQQPEVVPSVPVAPPHIRALQRLEVALGLLDQAEAFSVAVSSAVREYLEDRFVFHAPERTTEEFLIELRRTELLTETQKEVLAGFLTECDLVKFARYEPGVAELRQLHQAAVNLVEETQPRPELVEAQV